MRKRASCIPSSASRFPSLTGVEFDDHAHFGFEADVLAGRQRNDFAGQVGGIKGQPLGGDDAGAFAQRLEELGLGALLAQGDDVANLHGVGRNVHLLAVDADVAMHNDLTGGTAGLAQTQTVHNVVQAQFEQLSMLSPVMPFMLVAFR